MHVLIAVASPFAATRDIAALLARELQDGRLGVTIMEARAVRSVAEYDAVILGSSIYAGDWLPGALDFVTRHRDRLTTVPLWVYCSGSPADPPRLTSAVLQRLVQPLDPATARDYRVFTTRAERSLGGDFREWDAIRTWARLIARSLLNPPAALSLSGQRAG